MEVILLEQIHKLGGLGARVKVKSGYGRNYLIPKGKAVLATPENIEYFEAQRAELEKKQQTLLERATSNTEKIASLVVIIARKAGPEGKLFGSVSAADIAEAVTQAGAELTKHQVILPDGPIRTVGDHDIALQLHAGVTAVVKIQIIAEE